MAPASFDLADFDDGPTVVTASPFFNTAVMDRRQMPPPVSGVMPVAAPAYAAPAYAAAVYAAPAYAPPSAAPPSIAPRRPSSPEYTQPALRVRRDLAGTRRLAAGLAIGFAFLFGLAGAFVVQTMNAEAPSPIVIARTPREVTERSSTLDTRSTPDAVPRAEAPLASAPRVRSKHPNPNAPPPVTTEAEPAAPPENDSVEDRDLLGEGIGAP
jgi:hypothetical protein